ncbi:hypothetical protein, partial [Xanthovirga aplysinae]|uniref:hypothetical protein n=1 Tax=Xanthovirga aplysinae TaxID=2529853 RepID=UPI001656B68B
DNSQKFHGHQYGNVNMMREINGIADGNNNDENWQTFDGFQDGMMHLVSGVNAITDSRNNRNSQKAWVSQDGLGQTISQVNAIIGAGGVGGNDNTNN